MILKGEESIELRKLDALILLSVFILLCAWPAKAADESSQSIDVDKILGESIENTLIGLSFGKYVVTSDRFQKIYRKEHYIYGLDLTRIIIARKQHNLALSFEVKHFSKTGASTFTNTESKITIVPFSLSARYMYQINNFIPYIGFGLDYYKYKEESELHDTSDHTGGYHIQWGLYFQIPWIKAIKVEAHMKYTQAYTSENGITVDLGGFEYGISLVFGFDWLKGVAF